MEKKVMSKQELLDNREQLIADYYGVHRKSAKKPMLSKKERKVLGIGKDLGKATVKHVRISPSKVNIVIRLIKGKPVNEALAILKYTPKAASPVLTKLINSAVANAVNNNNLAQDSLYIDDCYVGQGPILKRYLPRGKGSASSIHKRTSHITVVVKEKA